MELQAARCLKLHPGSSPKSGRFCTASRAEPAWRRRDATRVADARRNSATRLAIGVRTSPACAFY
eukprot:15445140-Alexandrium_andersonii.AAC.1